MGIKHYGTLPIALSLFTLSCQGITTFRPNHYPERTSNSSGELMEDESSDVEYTGSARSDAMAREIQKVDAEAQKIHNVAQPKKRVVVFDFWNNTPVPEEGLGAFVAEVLKRNLSSTRRIMIPTDLKSEYTTADFVEGEQVKVAQLIREARKLGIPLLVIGRIKKIAFRQQGDEVGLFRKKHSLAAAEIEAKLFDVGSGREIMASTQLGEATYNGLMAIEFKNTSGPEFRRELTHAAVREAVEGLIPDIVKAVEKTTWQGRIAKLVGTKIYINAGKASGLIVGDILRVLTAGDDVYDPGSGTYLGHSKGQLKGTLEVTEFIGTDGAMTQLHTGGNIREGDLVQLY